MDIVELVDLAHARLAVRYGVLWLRMWEGLDPAAVRADWCKELARMPDWRVRWALDNMPADRNPPTAAQFKAICMQAPDKVIRLPSPKPGPISVEKRAMLDRARQAECLNAADPLGWARSLLRRAKAGEKLSMAQLDALKAVAHKLGEVQG